MKLSRRRLIEIFVKHRYWYNQGNNTLATLSVFPIEKIAIVAATVKYLLGEHISSNVIWIVGGSYLIYRVLIRWAIGLIWHRSDGYDIESEWNKGKVPPSRVELINAEDIVKAFRSCSKSFPECKEIKRPDKVRPDWVHPDDGWRPEPSSGKGVYNNGIEKS